MPNTNKYVIDTIVMPNGNEIVVGGTPVLKYDEESSAGYAVAGTAKVDNTPFYTPSGEIVLTNNTVEVMSGFNLYGTKTNGCLSLVKNFEYTDISMPSGAVFNGTSVNFKIEKET